MSKRTRQATRTQPPRATKKQRSGGSGNETDWWVPLDMLVHHVIPHLCAVGHVKTVLNLLETCKRLRDDTVWPTLVRFLELDYFLEPAEFKAFVGSGRHFPALRCVDYTYPCYHAPYKELDLATGFRGIAPDLTTLWVRGNECGTDSVRHAWPSSVETLHLCHGLSPVTTITIRDAMLALPRLKHIVLHRNYISKLYEDPVLRLRQELSECYLWYNDKMSGWPKERIDALDIFFCDCPTSACRCHRQDERDEGSSADDA